MRTRRSNAVYLLLTLVSCSGVGWYLSGAPVEPDRPPVRVLPEDVSLSVDEIHLKTPYEAARASLKGRFSRYEEKSDYEVLYLIGGKHLVGWYGPDPGKNEYAWGGEVVFGSDRSVEQTGGYTLQADGRTVLVVGDSEEKARAVLGPPSSFVAETAHTLGGYWRSRHLAILFYSEDFPRKKSPANVCQITLWEDRKKAGPTP